MKENRIKEYVEQEQKLRVYKVMWKMQEEREEQ